MSDEHQRHSYSTISSDAGGSNRKVVTKKTTTVMPYDINSGVIPPPGTQEEWTTTKRRINHKTKQVETRVQRQIIMEDGKVIADSGPQVTTKTTEDQKSDEQEDTKHRLLADSEVPEKYRKDIGNQVVAEKTVTHNVTKEAKEENYQYHDESLRELDGPDIHRKAVEEPHKLISIENEIPAIPRGKLVHFSAKGHKTNDRDEILEVSRLDKDGLLNTETTQTQYHEEYEDDEVPEDDPRARMIQDDDDRGLHQEQRRQLEYHGRLEDEPRVSSRNNSSLSMSRNDKKSSKKSGNRFWEEHHHQDDDIIETSEVYKLSDKMRSLKSSKSNSSTRKSKTKKDDASTQASFSDSGDEQGQPRTSSHKHLAEVHERFGSRRSSFHTHDDEPCCDLLGNQISKPKKHYYYGAEPSGGDGGEKGYISASVKTSKFAMENDRVIEDKTFEEDFERSFKDKNQKYEVTKDYDRFKEKTMEYTKGIRDRAMSPKLPPSGPSTEFIHRPTLIDSTTSFDHKPGRSRSFYNHQIEGYENKTHKSYNEPRENYSRDHGGSSYRLRSPSPMMPGSGTWTKQRDHRYDHHSSSNTTTTRNHSTPYRGTGGDGTSFPDFAPLSSPYEIKTLTENAMKNSRHHLTSYH